MASPETVMEVLDLLERCWPGVALKDGTAQAYHAVLEPLPDALLLKAAQMVARSGAEFFPPAGKLFQAALDLVDDQPGASEAWGIVLKGAQTSKQLSDLPRRAALAIEDSGGFRLLKMSPDDALPPFRARFIQAYEARKQGERASMAIDSGKLLEGPS